MPFGAGVSYFLVYQKTKANPTPLFCKQKKKAKQIHKEKILQAKEKFIELKSQHEKVINQRNQKFRRPNQELRKRKVGCHKN